MKYYLLICSCLFFLLSCSANKQQEAEFVQADSVLNNNLDSALILLKTLPRLQELSQSEYARYSLLMVRAADKAVKPLLPCDSLLNVAIHYYNKDNKERAAALLYKGWLEIETNDLESAITYRQERLDTLAIFLIEAEKQNLTLSFLGNLYFNVRQYEDAIKVYKKLYHYCITDKDKSIVLKSISRYYCIKNREDSTMIIQQQALGYALFSKNSIIISSSLLSISLSFYDLSKVDSALFYAQKTLVNAPIREYKGRYYYNLGHLSIETKCNRDSVSFYIDKSTEDQTFSGRFLSLLTLSDLETGNYKIANIYIQEYTANLDSITTIEKKLKLSTLSITIMQKYKSGKNDSEDVFKCYLPSLIL